MLPILRQMWPCTARRAQRDIATQHVASMWTIPAVPTIPDFFLTLSKAGEWSIHPHRPFAEWDDQDSPRMSALARFAIEVQS